MSANRRLGGGIADYRRAAAGPHQRQLGRLFLDYVGCAVAGSSMTDTRRVAPVILAHSHGRSTVLGTTTRTGPAAAAFLNAFGTNCLDAEDTYPTAMIHLQGVVFSAVAALAGERTVNGQLLVRAAMCGYDLAAAVAREGHYARGWHSSSTIGVLAAAAASSVVLGLDADACGEAISLATASASGVRGQFGSAAKALQVGRAAECGVVAALLAEQGLRGADVDAAHNWFSMVGLDGPPTMPTDKGAALHVVSLKMYPIGMVLQSLAQLAVDNRAVLVDLPSTEHVTAVLSPAARELASIDLPRDEVAAKLSPSYVVAAAACRGRPGPNFLRGDGDVGRVEQFARRVRVDTDDELGLFDARLEVSGRSLERAAHSSAARGPTLDRMLRDKFISNVESLLPPEAATREAERLLSVAETPDLGELLNSLTKETGAATVATR